ncbi:MAG: hypothetical protein ACO1N7_06630 [Sphingobacteriaceae bacterium]
MKNILLVLFLSLLFATSCKKDNDQNEPKTDVKFQFTNFNWEVGPLGKSSSTISDVDYTTGDTLENYAKYFYYRAYNASGVKVSEKSQTAENADFGILSDVLDPGTYTIVFSASNKPLGFSRYGLNGDHLFNQDNGYWSDTFFKKLTITVGSEPSTHPITLERIVGALEVTLLDAIPMNAAKISISAEYEHGVFWFRDGSRSATDTKTKEFILTEADKGQSNRSFLMHILNITRGLRITIKSFDAQNGLLNSKTIDNVLFYQNRKTILRGNLSSASQFLITVDPVWGIPTDPITF